MVGRISIPLALGVVALVWLPGTVEAQVIYSCVSKTGSITIVSATTTCPKGSTSLSWNVAGPQGPPGAGALILVDSNGTTVGTVSELNHVNMRINGLWIQLIESDQQFTASGQKNVTFLFTTPDCTGTQYVDRSTPVAGTWSDGATIFYGADPTQTIQVQSSAASVGGSLGYCNSYPSLYSTTVGVATVLDPTTLGFVPPFHVQ
jgi:hypothetical protein